MDVSCVRTRLVPMFNIRILGYLTLINFIVQPVFAGELSATLGVTSDYVFRGVSLTDGPALQGSIDYTFENGFNIGTWSSNYDFDTATNQEVDLYIGYSRSLSKSNTLVAGASRYTFLDEHEVDYGEYHVGLSHENLDARIWYATDYGGSTSDAQYYELGFNTSFLNDIALELRTGYSVFDAALDIEDYTDLSVAIRKSFYQFDTELKFTDTDQDQYGDRDEARLIVSISTTFQ